MRGISLVVVLAGAILLAGCGGADSNGQASPRDQGIKSTYEGGYQVKGMEDGLVQGVGIYDNGSFRIIVEGSPRVVIHNEESGENWEINLRTRTYEELEYDEALLQAGFMPHQAMRAYFDLDRYWSGDVFRMEGAGENAVNIYLGGPEYLPSSWEAEEAGNVFTEVSWEYRRVSEISPENFVLPEGVTSAAGG
ncbi:MAG: hypothetical protein SWK76_10040 [Actinomycetota bacterium]|nr:hypothetical protein [Actinomycetota bacterium]